MDELIIFATGFIVGVMNAVAGGGMLIGFPILVAIGISPLTVNATSHLISGPGQIASIWGYRNYLRHIPKRFVLLTLPLVVGAIAGAYVLRNTSAESFADIVPALVLFGVALFTFQPILHFHVHQHLLGKHRTITPLFWIALAMLPLAFYGGYFGAGFGFMMLAFLSFARLHDIHVMNALKNIGATVVSLTAILCLHSSGHIDWRIGIIGACGAIAGGYLGARGSQKISSHWLRAIVIGIGLGAVMYLALRTY